MLLKWTLLKPVAPDYTGAIAKRDDYDFVVHSYAPKNKQPVKKWGWAVYFGALECVARSPKDKPFPSRKAAIAGAEAWVRNQEAIRG